MSVRAYRDIARRKSRKIRVGKVEVGGDAPITVQSMTNTVTADIRGTIAQIRGLEEAGADIVRVSCPDEDATRAMKAITAASNIPVVADIHFHYKRAIEAAVDVPGAELITAKGRWEGSRKGKMGEASSIDGHGAFRRHLLTSGYEVSGGAHPN